MRINRSSTRLQRKSLQPGSVRFLFDGERVREDQSPQELDMEDGDSLDAMMEQASQEATTTFKMNRNNTKRAFKNISQLLPERAGSKRLRREERKPCKKQILQIRVNTI